MYKISPSILSANFARLMDDIKIVENANVEMLHIDVMDGHFVPNITIGAPVLKSLNAECDLPMDVHLMIENPDLYIKDFVDAGADIISVHAESTNHLHRTIQLIKSFGAKACVALNPATPLCVLEEVIADLDMVLLMTVNPGFGGQKFIEASLDKIERLKKMIDTKNLNIDIQVDGGVKLDNVEKIARAGANNFVAGSAIFASEDIQGTVNEFREIFEGLEG